MSSGLKFGWLVSLHHVLITIFIEAEGAASFVLTHSRRVLLLSHANVFVFFRWSPPGLAVAQTPLFSLVCGTCVSVNVFLSEGVDDHLAVSWLLFVPVKQLCLSALCGALISLVFPCFLQFLFSPKKAGEKMLVVRLPDGV